MHYEDTYNRIIDLKTSNKGISKKEICEGLSDIPERDVMAVITDIAKNHGINIE